MIKSRALPLLVFVVAATVGTWILYFSFRRGLDNDPIWSKADYHDQTQQEKPLSEQLILSSANTIIQQTTTKKAETPQVSSTLSTSSTTPPQTLGVEQIDADFPGDYKNPNNWFRSLPTPKRKDAENLLTPEEWAILPTFSKLGSHTDARIAKIESFYGINTSSDWTWQKHINSLDDEGLAPMTKWIQNFVHNHQHPASCENKTFYVLDNKWPRHGLGALIKRILVELSFAINSNTILVFDPENAPGNTLVDPSCAKEGREPSLQCIVEDITSCGAYVNEKNTVRTLTPEMFRGGKQLEFPPVVQAALMASMEHNGIYPTGNLLRYWWRSQLYGYIMRPRKEVLARMVEMRTNSTLQVGMQLSRQKSGAPKIKSQTLPFPLPPSTMSMHIRHGDKGGEMRIVSSRDYVVAAERFLHRNPIIYRKRAFVTTEDPGVIDYLSKTAYINPSQSYGNSDWTWFYSNISRVNGGPQANLVVNHNKTNALITHMMQLWMAVECDSFVGHRNSNWNKMIDAVRCTLMDKCRMPYLDPGFVADWENFP